MTDEDLPRRRGLLANLGQNVRAAYDADRRRNPHRFNTDPDVLFVENVAEILGCGVDHVRRISRADLPCQRVGNRVVYLREDVIAYLRRRRAPTVLPAPAHGPKAGKPAPFDPVARAKGTRSSSNRENDDGKQG